MAVWQLDDELWFPNPRWGEDDGLVAVGGDLSVERLVLAYSNGFFPWYAFQVEREPHWYCPLDRYVIFPNEIHISHSMRQLLKQHKYEVTVNQDFEGVINGCSQAQGRNEESGAWLGPDIIEAFTRLHHQGYVASVEVWKSTNTAEGRRLVGGLYGVTLRHAFFGESMFSLVPNASKLALIHLAKVMERIGGRFIDCQFETPLFKSMGGRHITYEEYMKILEKQQACDYSILGDILTYPIDVDLDLDISKIQLMDAVLKELSSDGFTESEASDFWNDFDNLQKAKIIR